MCVEEEHYVVKNKVVTLILSGAENCMNSRSFVLLTECERVLL